MKKIIVALVMAFALTGCITVEKPAEAPKTEKTEKVTPKTQETTEAPAPEPELSEDEVDAVFVALVREKIDAFDSVTDDQIVTTGKQICTDLQMANTQEELSAYMLGFYSEVKEYMSEYEVGYFVGASVGAYCPEKSDLMEGIGA